MALAASSDSKTTVAIPESSFFDQYPATKPGACDIPGTTRSCRCFSATSWSLIEILTTTACIPASFAWVGKTRPYWPGKGGATWHAQRPPGTAKQRDEPSGRYLEAFDVALDRARMGTKGDSGNQPYAPSDPAWSPGDSGRDQRRQSREAGRPADSNHPAFTIRNS